MTTATMGYCLSIKAAVWEPLPLGTPLVPPLLRHAGPEALWQAMTAGLRIVAADNIS